MRADSPYRWRCLASFRVWLPEVGWYHLGCGLTSAVLGVSRGLASPVIVGRPPPAICEGRTGLMFCACGRRHALGEIPRLAPAQE